MISSECTSGLRVIRLPVLTAGGKELLRSGGRGIPSRQGADAARDRDIRVSLMGGLPVSSSHTCPAVRVDPGTSIQDTGIRAIPGSGLAEGIRDTGTEPDTRDIAPREVLPVSGPALATPVNAPLVVLPVVGLDIPGSAPLEVPPVVDPEPDTPGSGPPEALPAIDRQQAFPVSGQDRVSPVSDLPRGEVLRAPAGISVAAKGRRSCLRPRRRSVRAVRWIPGCRTAAGAGPQAGSTSSAGGCGAASPGGIAPCSYI